MLHGASRDSLKTNRWVGRSFVLASLAILVSCNPEEPPSESYEIQLDVTESIRALGADDLFESESAIDGLAALGPSVIPALEAAFEREDAPVRRGVMEVLQQLDSAEADALLLRAVDDPDEEVRIRALEAVAASDSERARPVIERALNDPSAAIYHAAVDACAEACSSPAAIRRIVEIALHDPPFIRVSLPRQTLRYILRQNDTKRAQTARDTIMEVALPLLAPSAESDARLRAALLVADLNDPAAIPALHEALTQPIRDTPPKIRAQMQIQAMSALGRIGNGASVAILRETVARGGPLQAGACRALDQLAIRGVAGADEQIDQCGEAE